MHPSGASICRLVIMVAKLGMNMPLTGYSTNAAELQRTEDLLRVLTSNGCYALEVGARDGHSPRLLTDKFDLVAASYSGKKIDG